MKIKILSPVHIGAGERKTRMNFVLKDNKAYFINEDLFNSLINNAGLTDKFIQWASQGGNDISQFLSDYSEIENKLLEKSLYVLPIRGFIDRDVALHIKDSENRFFIPGSSIKGAIRTALLYNVLEETRPDINQLLKGIPDTDIIGVLNVDKNKSKWIGMEIEKFVFRTGFRKNDGIISYGDAKYDLLKFIHFSDAYPLKAEYSIMPVRTFSSISKTLMNVKSHITNVEVIESGEFSCNLEIDMKSLLLLKNVDERKEWIGLKKKFKDVFGFNLTELESNNLEKYKVRIIDRLLETCTKFYQKKMEKDWELIDNKEVKDRYKSFSLERLKDLYPKVLKGIIELGFGGGWKGKTMGLYWEDKILAELRRQFELGKFYYKIICKPCKHIIGIYPGTSATNWKKILTKKGVLFKKDGVYICPKCNKELERRHPLQPTIENLIWPFPKTLHLAFWFGNNKPNMFPLGWIRLEP
jgi:CRISPR type III-A-associated RAMP protein Csm5